MMLDHNRTLLNCGNISNHQIDITQHMVYHHFDSIRIELLVCISFSYLSAATKTSSM